MKCIQHIMKENLLLLKDWLEPEKNKYMTSVSKNVDVDKLDDIVYKYNNIYHTAIKMKPFDVKQTDILTLVKKLMIKILNLKLVVLLEYQNRKSIFAKVYTPNLSEEVFAIKTVKKYCAVDTCYWWS